MQKTYLRPVLALIILSIGILIPPQGAFAESPLAPPHLVDTPRFTLYFPQPKNKNRVATSDLARRSITALNLMYNELSTAFGESPRAKVVLRFMSPKDFHKETGAPEWTSAMFLRGEISIPLTDAAGANFYELRRAIRHEYVHAVISELSGKRCPAWLDEGLAQFFEGDPNPLLGPALRSWIVENESLPLDWLQNGFMTLNDELVPVAYAQSLYATRLLVDKHGFGALKDYLTGLRDGTEESDAFRLAFDLDEKDFEDQLTEGMRRWAGSSAKNP